MGNLLTLYLEFLFTFLNFIYTWIGLYKYLRFGLENRCLFKKLFAESIHLLTLINNYLLPYTSLLNLIIKKATH